MNPTMYVLVIGPRDYEEVFGVYSTLEYAQRAETLISDVQSHKRPEEGEWNERGGGWFRGDEWAYIHAFTLDAEQRR